jgi:hypothetical protein
MRLVVTCGAVEFGILLGVLHIIHFFSVLPEILKDHVACFIGQFVGIR